MLGGLTPEMAITTIAFRLPLKFFLFDDGSTRDHLPRHEECAVVAARDGLEPHLPTVLKTDAAKTRGLGYALLQRHGDNWRLVHCGSRFLADTESRYAVV